MTTPSESSVLSNRLVPQFALAIGLVALLTWALATPVSILRQQLTQFQFWSLEICVAFGVPLASVALWQMASVVRRRDLLGMACAACVGLGLTLGVAPRTSRIFYDEQIYQNIGQNMADLKLAQMCNDGDVSNGRLQCRHGEYNKQPYAYPHLLSLLDRAGADRSGSAFVVNAAAQAALIGLVYLVVLVMFDDSMAAFCAALLMALTPEQAAWSASGAVEPTASAACVAAMLAAAWFVRSRTSVALAGAAVATAYAIQFRPESILIVPVVAFLIWQRAPDELSRSRLWWAATLFLALAAVHVGHLAAVRDEGWGTTQPRLSIHYALANIRVNAPFYLADRRFPALWTILAVVGLVWPRTAVRRLAWLCYFLSFFLIALFFYAGSFDYGADVRYSLATYPPLAVLGGLGVARVGRLVHNSRFETAAIASLALLLAGQFAYCFPIIGSTSDSAWAARADVEFARTSRPLIPDDAYVLTQNPGMFQVWGVNAGQISLVANDRSRLTTLFDRYRGGVYLHWNFWCNVQDEQQRRFCSTVLAAGTVQTVGEAWVQDEHFAFYKLKGGPGPDR